MADERHFLLAHAQLPCLFKPLLVFVKHKFLEVFHVHLEHVAVVHVMAAHARLALLPPHLYHTATALVVGHEKVVVPL